MAVMASPGEKAMTRISTVGSELAQGRTPPRFRRRPTGFTLVELIIALTILVTLTAVLAPVMFPSPGRSLRQAGSEIATTLRETRRHAQAEQARRRFLMDTQSGSYGIEKVQRQHVLPEGMSAQLTTAESLLTGETTGGIDFFPDGSSTGGRVLLGMDDQSLQVDIEWLTGRIRVSEID
jgi:general secretion pathway protein H